MTAQATFLSKIDLADDGKSMNVMREIDGGMETIKARPTRSPHPCHHRISACPTPIAITVLCLPIYLRLVASLLCLLARSAAGHRRHRVI